MPETIEVGELLYEAKLQITSTETFGITMEAILGGQPVPPAGARFDIAVEGISTGRVGGVVKAVDYLWMRPDGRAQLHIHGSMETPGGARIAFAAAGTSALNEATGLYELRETLELHTASPEFEWVNAISVWARGTLNMATGELILKGYVA